MIDVREDFRVIASVIVSKGKVVKGAQFRNHRYVGDPINTCKIFSNKFIDELYVIDISASADGRVISTDFVNTLSEEIYAPLIVGGGVNSPSAAVALVRSGADRVSLNSGALRSPQLIRSVADEIGGSSTVVAIDIAFSKHGKYEVVVPRKLKRKGIDPVEWAQEAASYGAGEILINSVEQEGTWSGANLELAELISSNISAPVVYSGGTRDMIDIEKLAGIAGISGVSVGAMFTFAGIGQGVLLSYPDMSRD
jgi:cyclase